MREQAESRMGGEHPGSRICSGGAIRGEARRRLGFSPAEQLTESSISASPFAETTANKQTAPLLQGAEGQEGFSNLSCGSLAE
jgi:hypothetical protein